MWTRYLLAYRLLSPLHVGYRKSGNLMQTRPYVLAKTLWGAITAHGVRMNGWGKGDYGIAGDAVKSNLRVPYLFPALRMSNPPKLKRCISLDGFTLFIPPLDALGEYLLLDSYASTAIGDGRTAEHESLHEVEMIAPRTRPLQGTPLKGCGEDGADDIGAQVYLVGELYVSDGANESLKGWQDVLTRLQLGGERRYGWGRVELESLTPREDTSINPTITLSKKDKWTLAHVRLDSEKVLEHLDGRVEVLVGWERSTSDSGSSEPSEAVVRGQLQKRRV